MSVEKGVVVVGGRARRLVSAFGRAANERADRWALLSILALGAVLRLWGNGFGLPHLYHPDEGYLVMPAVRMLRSGSFNPGWFDYGSLFIYALLAAYVLYFLAGARAGVFRVVQDIPYHERFREVGAYRYPTLFMVSRSVSAFFGTAIVLTVYLLARRLFGKRVGLVAALLVALFPPLVLDAHFATTDTAMTFFVALAVLLSSVLYERDDGRIYALAGLVAGLAISTKYSAFPVAVTPIAAHLLKGRQRGAVLDPKLLLTLGGVAVGFLLGSPFILADLDTFLNYLAKQLQVYGRPGSELPLSATGLWWLRYMFAPQFWPMTVSSLVGMGYGLRREPRRTLILLTPVVLFWTIVLTQVTRYERSWLPSAPILVLFAAYGIVELASALARGVQKVLPLKPAHSLALGLLPLVAFWGAAVALNDLRMTQPDVRTLALEWAEQNLSHDSRVAIDLAGPPLTDPPWEVDRYLSIGEQPLAHYRDERYDYVIVSQRGQQNPNLTETQVDNYRSIEEGAELVVALSGVCVHLPDCNLWVYRLSQGER